MDVGDLAPALLALGEIFHEANALRYPDGAPVRLEIRAFNTGSFDVALSLDADRDQVPESVQLCVYRVVQEALTNVRKHADATVVRVSAEWGTSGFEVSIADNGRGFDPASADGATYGIRGMHERAGLIGGAVEILSKPRDGTRVVVRVPSEVEA